MKVFNLIVVLLLLFGFVGCKDEDERDGDLFVPIPIKYCSIPLTSGKDEFLLSGTIGSDATTVIIVPDCDSLQSIHQIPFIYINGKFVRVNEDLDDDINLPFPLPDEGLSIASGDWGSVVCKGEENSYSINIDFTENVSENDRDMMLYLNGLLSYRKILITQTAAK